MIQTVGTLWPYKERDARLQTRKKTVAMLRRRRRSRTTGRCLGALWTSTVVSLRDGRWLLLLRIRLARHFKRPAAIDMKIYLN